MDINDKLKITLHYNDSYYPLTVERENEEVYRAAEKKINDLLNTYRERFPKKDRKTYDDIVMLNLAVDLLKEQQNKDAEPFRESIKQLIDELESIFKNE